MFRLFVPGHAQPAGSKRSLPVKGGGRNVVVDANPKSAGWKEDVRGAVIQVLRESGRSGDYPITGPVALDLVFQRARPKSQLTSKGELRKGAPSEPCSKPDALKLARGVEDALTGRIYHDDAQVTTIRSRKVFASIPGVWITVWDLSVERPEGLMTADDLAPDMPCDPEVGIFQADMLRFIGPVASLRPRELSAANEAEAEFARKLAYHVRNQQVIRNWTRVEPPRPDWGSDD